jgi:hypothetical protein
LLFVGGCRQDQDIPSAPVQLTVASADGAEVRSWDAEWEPRPERMGSVLRVRDRLQWSAVAAGSYQVTVTAPGYQTATVDITVIEDRPIGQDVVLTPAG